jgi:hypothetical protein
VEKIGWISVGMGLDEHDVAGVHPAILAGGMPPWYCIRFPSHGSISESWDWGSVSGGRNTVSLASHWYKHLTRTPVLLAEFADENNKQHQGLDNYGNWKVSNPALKAGGFNLSTSKFGTLMWMIPLSVHRVAGELAAEERVN